MTKLTLGYTSSKTRGILRKFPKSDSNHYNFKTYRILISKYSREAFHYSRTSLLRTPLGLTEKCCPELRGVLIAVVYLSI
jgi:hypothetical protein